MDPSSWLCDSRLDKARVGIGDVMKKLIQLKGEESELLNTWKRLKDFTTARRALAEMNELVECRHHAAENLDEYSMAETKLFDELEMRLALLEKTGNIVLEEYLNASNSVKGTGSPHTSSAVGWETISEGDSKLGDRRVFVFFGKRERFFRDSTYQFFVMCYRISFCHIFGYRL